MYAYFNNESIVQSLESILYGYAEPHLRPKSIEVVSDEFSRIYLPNFGWLLTQNANMKYLLKTHENKISLYCDEKETSFVLEPIKFVQGTSIELLRYNVPLFKQCYFDTTQNLIDVEIEKITNQHEKNLIEAFGLIKIYLPTHFELIEKATKKCVIFNVETHLRNSFAIMSAQGTGFFNAYQDTYNEVFFVDDIVHQTGHIIFNAILYDASRFIIPNPNEILQRRRLVMNNEIETRSVSVVFHALYTYYTTFIALDACLNAEVFEGYKKHEALGRIAFYIDKCYQDIISIDSDINNEEGAKKIFTDEGMIVYLEIKNTLKKTVKKWATHVKDFDMNQQPYNFTYKIFLELNQL